MFGFSGHWEGKIDYTAHSEREGSGVTNKKIVWGSDYLNKAGVYGTVIYDVNNEDGTAPATMILNEYTSESFTKTKTVFEIPNSPNNPNLAYINTTGANGVTTLYKAYDRNLNSTGFYYGTTGNLTPATRRILINYNRPDLIKTFGYTITSNNFSSTANQLNSVLNDTINLEQFSNLETACFYGGFYTIPSNTLTIRLPKKIKYVIFCPQGVAGQTISIVGKLPESTKTFFGFGFSLATTTFTINGLFDNCNLDSICMAIPSNFTTAYPAINPTNNRLSGSVNISHMTNLKEFILAYNTTITSLSLPVGNTAWKNFLLQNLNNTIVSSINSTTLEDVISSTQLQTFCLTASSFVKNRNITSSDINSSLIYFWIYGNSWTGNISITTSKPNLKDFRTGNISIRTGIQQNSHTNVNITGLTNATTIDLTGSNIENLELPVNTVCTSLNIYDNKLDTTVNTNLVSQINAMTALTTLQISTANNEGAVVGQASTSGIGSNKDFSGLVNLTTFLIGNSKVSGTLTVPNVNKLVQFQFSDNPNLTSIVNFSSHVGLATIRGFNCPSLSIAITSAFTTLTLIQFQNTNLTAFDASGRTTTNLWTALDLTNTSISSVTFPAAQINNKWTNSVSTIIDSCANLTSITNLDTINYNSPSGTNIVTFSCKNNPILNISFPLGVNGFIPRSITIQNNAMNTLNIDATIDSMYTNRIKWAGYTAAKTLNIAGAGNGIASGTYQAPAGFVLNGTDGTSGVATAKEQIYVLVNNYNWTITYN